MRNLILILSLIFCLKTYSASSKNKDSSSQKIYSFQPLLIKGKRQFVKKIRDIKVEDENIVNSNLFFLKDSDVKKRIFEEENLE